MKSWQQRLVRAKKRFNKYSASQRGLASIVIVAVLVTILTLVSVGFARLMSRAIQNTRNNELSAAASYAAQSEINDAITYLRQNPSASSSSCGALLTTSTLGSASPNSNAKYTCLLLNQTPTDLSYGDGGADPLTTSGGPQVIKLTTATVPSKYMFSWSPADNTPNSMALPPSASTGLIDETTWSKDNYAPLLRLALYPIPTSGSLTNVSSGSRTYFLYPTSASESNTIDYANKPDGSLVPVDCNSTTVSGFTSSTPVDNYLCNVVIDDFGSVVANSGDYFFASITPLYTDAKLLIQANDSNNKLVQFVGVQADIDATAQSGTAAKRLQAAVDLGSAGGGPDYNINPSQDAIPQYGVQSAEAICKMIVVTGSSAQTNDPFCAVQTACTATQPDCIVPPEPPSVVTLNPTGITPTSANFTGTVKPNYDAITNCQYDIGTSSGNYTTSRPCSTADAAFGSEDATTTDSTPVGLSPDTTYYYRIEATNGIGTTLGNEVSFTTPGAPTVVTGGASVLDYSDAILSGSINPEAGQPAQNGAAITNCQYDIGTSSGNYTTSQPCSAADGNIYPYSDSTTISGLSQHTTYYYRIEATNSYGTGYGAEMQFTTPWNPHAIPPLSDQLCVSSGSDCGDITVYAGASVTLYWSIYNAQNCSPNFSGVNLDGNGNDPSDSTTFNVGGDGTYTYSLPCWGFDGSSYQDPSVTVNVVSVQILSFSSLIWDQGPYQCGTGTGYNNYWLCRNGIPTECDFNDYKAGDGPHNCTTNGEYGTLRYTQVTGYDGCAGDYGGGQRFTSCPNSTTWYVQLSNGDTGGISCNLVSETYGQFASFGNAGGYQTEGPYFFNGSGTPYDIDLDCWGPYLPGGGNNYTSYDYSG